MKRPDHQPTSANKPTSQRLRALLALGAIAVAGAGGYKCGQDSQAERIQQLESESVSKDKRLADTEKNLEQVRHTAESLNQSQRVTVTKLLEAEEKISHPDEQVCIDVIDKALHERVFRIASLFGLTNQSDINALKAALQKGYTQVENVFGDGTGIALVDPNAEEGSPHRYTSITLEEPIKDIPEKYLSDYDKVPKSAEELALEQKIADGKAEEVISSFNPESVRPASEDPKSTESQLFNAFVDLQTDFSKTTDPTARKDLFCRFFAEIMKVDIAESESDGDEPDTPSASTDEEIRKNRLMDLYMEAMLKLVGMEDEEECLYYILESPPACTQAIEEKQ